MSLIASQFGVMEEEKGKGVDLEAFVKALKIRYENSRSPSYPGCDSYRLGPVETGRICQAIEEAKELNILYQEESRVYFVWDEMESMPESYFLHYLKKMGKEISKDCKNLSISLRHYKNFLENIKKIKRNTKDIDDEVISIDNVIEKLNEQEIKGAKNGLH